MEPNAKPSWARRAVVLFLTVAFFPGEILLPSSGLDPSWQWALNVLPHQGVVFGRDTTFTYGPLGFLVVPQDVGANVWLALAFRVALQALFAVSLLVLLREAPWQRAAVAVAVLMLSGLALYPDFDAHVFVVLAAAALALDRSRHPALGAAVAALVPVLVLMKTTYGSMAVILLGPVLALWVLQRPRAAVAPVMLATASFVFVLAGLVASCFGSASAFVTWLGIALEFVAGYTDAMAQPGPQADLIAAVALMVLSVAYFALRARGERRFVLLGVALALAVFVVFKRGFVRQGHSVSFFSSLGALLALLLAQAQPRRTWALGAVAAVATLASAAVFQTRDRLLTPRSVLSGLSGARGASTLLGWLPPRPQLPGTFVADVLPQEWVELIRREGDGVIGVLSFDLAIAPANGLTLRPNPVLQTYAAYTARLDQLDADHFASARAPRFLLIDFRGLEARNVFVDTPATWRVLLRQYEVRAAGQRTLLQRRATPRRTLEGSSWQQLAAMGEWIAVPPSDGVLEAVIEAPLRLEGRLLRAGLRLPKVLLEWEYEDGTWASCTPLMDTLSNGVAVSHLPRDLAQLNTLLRGQAISRVKRFRLSGDAARLYGPEVRVTWRPSVGFDTGR